MPSMPIVELIHIAVATATLTVPGTDTWEYRIELVDVRTDEVLVSLPAVSAVELGKRILGQARVASR